MSDQNHMPTVEYWHLYVDDQGESRQKRCVMTEFELGSMGDADPQWKGNKHHDGMTTMFTVLPVGWIGTWHENPAPQWIIPLSGKWSVEAMDGTKREFGRGEVSFGEDQGCQEQDGKKGHRSTTVGNQPATLMIVQFDTKRQKITPCRFT